MEIVNEGIPSEVEWRRLQKSMCNAKKYDSMSYLFEGDDDSDELAEGAGIGVPQISVMLKNMNLSLSDFNVIVDGGKTIARLFFPFSFFAKKP